MIGQERKDTIISVETTQFLRASCIVPTPTIDVERAITIVDQMQPIPAAPVVSLSTFKHFPVDRNFLELLDQLKPTSTYWEKPETPLSEESQRKYNALRMREYRRKTNETLEKTKKMLEELQNQCTVNTVKLKNILNSKTVEDQVKKHVAHVLKITEMELMMDEDFYKLIRKYWKHRKTASESHYENKSLIYLERAVKLENDRHKHKETHGSRSSCQLHKKIKDAVMKAQAYEVFMDDKRVRKVIDEIISVDIRFKNIAEEWVMGRVQENNTDETSFVST